MISKHIIDLKPVLMSDDEWKLYTDICASYDNPPSQNGKDLFRNLFEVNGDGIIVMLKPPKHQTSFEIIFFISNLMMQQHIRLMQQRVDTICHNMETKIADLDAQIEDIKVNKKSKRRT